MEVAAGMVGLELAVLCFGVFEQAFGCLSMLEYGAAGLEFGCFGSENKVG